MFPSYFVFHIPSSAGWKEEGGKNRSSAKKAFLVAEGICEGKNNYYNGL